MKKKLIPLYFMLIAGAITSIWTFVLRYPLIKQLTYLLVVLIVFYCIGVLLKWVLSGFDDRNQKEEEIRIEEQEENAVVPQAEEDSQKG